MHPLTPLQHYLLLSHCLSSHASITQVDHINKCTSPFPPNLPPPHVRNSYAQLFPFMMHFSSTALPCTLIASPPFPCTLIPILCMPFLSILSPIFSCLPYTSPSNSLSPSISICSLLLFLYFHPQSLFLHSQHMTSIDFNSRN